MEAITGSIQLLAWVMGGLATVIIGGVVGMLVIRSRGGMRGQ